MNELQLINENGKIYVDSRQVAEMIGKRHADLMRSIDGYIKILANAKLRSLDFFDMSSYLDNQGKLRPCYKLTRKGCDMVANKLTGEKGVLFTAEYVTRFEQMEKQLLMQQQKPLTQLDILEQSIKLMKEQQKRLEEHSNRLAKIESNIEQIKELEQINASNWRLYFGSVTRKIAKYYPCLDMENPYQAIRHEFYERLENEAHCNLNIRLKNKKERAYKAGLNKNKIKELNKLDIIEEDARLINSAIAVLKKMSIQYGIN